MKSVPEGFYDQLYGQIITIFKPINVLQTTIIWAKS